MKILKISITNYRGIQSITHEFDSGLNVLIGNYKNCKSSLLSAISYMLSSYFTRMLPDNTVNPNLMEHLNPNISFNIEMDYEIDGIQYTLKKMGGYNTKNELTAYGSKCAESVMNGSDVELPIIAYYGATQLTSQDKIKYHRIGSRLVGYDGSMSPCIIGHKSFEWLKSREDSRLKFNASDDLYSVYVNTLKLVLPYISSIHFNWNYDDFTCDHDYYTKPFRLLNDGLQREIRFVSDLIYRLIILNPLMGLGVHKTHGIVLIDDIDLITQYTINPSIFESMRSAFPNIQFIITSTTPITCNGCNYI